MTKFFKNGIISCSLPCCECDEQLDPTISTESSCKESVDNILLFAKRKYSPTVHAKRAITKQVENKSYVYTESSSYSLLSKFYNITGTDRTSNGKNSSTCYCYHPKENITIISDHLNLSDGRLCLEKTPSPPSVCDINREVLIETFQKKQPSLKYPKAVCPRVIKPSTPCTRKCLNRPASCPSDPVRIHILNKRVFDRNLKKLTDRTSNVEKKVSSNKKKKRKWNKRRVACGIEKAKKFLLLMVSRHNKKLFKEIVNTLIKNKVKPKVCPVFRTNPKLKKIRICPYNCMKFH